MRLAGGGKEWRPLDEEEDTLLMLTRTGLQMRATPVFGIKAQVGQILGPIHNLIELYIARYFSAAVPCKSGCLICLDLRFWDLV